MSSANYSPDRHKGKARRLARRRAEFRHFRKRAHDWQETSWRRRRVLRGGAPEEREWAENVQ